MGPADAPKENAFLLCGKIVGVFGVRGWVKVRSYTHPEDALLGYTPWFVEGDGSFEKLQINSARRHNKGLVAQLNNTEDRDAAASLVGKEVWVSRDVLPQVEPGEYYWSDIERCDVFDTQQRLIGRVSYMLDAGAHDVMVVKNESNETLIPFDTVAVVKNVDLQACRIIVDWDWS